MLKIDTYNNIIYGAAGGDFFIILIFGDGFRRFLGDGTFFLTFFTLLLTFGAELGIFTIIDGIK